MSPNLAKSGQAAAAAVVVVAAAVTAGAAAVVVTVAADAIVTKFHSLFCIEARCLRASLFLFGFVLFGGLGCCCSRPTCP
jgi:hypothetical protein